MISAIWSYRGFIVGSVKREFQAKYQSSVLGAIWMVINPLAMIVVYTVIFSQIMQARLPGVDGQFSYSIYLCSGMLTWGLFAEMVGRSQNMFLEYANLIKKLSFPRLCLPVIAGLGALLNFIIIFGLFLIFTLLSGHFPGWAFFAIFPVLAIQSIFSMSLGLILGVFNVFFRDVGQFFGIVIQFWFWFTPIVYPSTILPEDLRLLLAFNPMVAIIEAYHTVFLYGKCPQWTSFLPIAAINLVLCALAFYLFRKHAGEIVDEL